MRNYRSRDTVKDGFRHIVTHSGWNHVYCGECTALARTREIVAIEIVPEPYETLTCAGCYAVNPTTAIVDEIEVQAQQDRKAFRVTKEDIDRYNE